MLQAHAVPSTRAGCGVSNHLVHSQGNHTAVTAEGLLLELLAAKDILALCMLDANGMELTFHHTLPFALAQGEL